MQNIPAARLQFLEAGSYGFFPVRPYPPGPLISFHVESTGKERFQFSGPGPHLREFFLCLLPGGLAGLVRTQIEPTRRGRFRCGLRFEYIRKRSLIVDQVRIVVGDRKVGRRLFCRSQRLRQ